MSLTAEKLLDPHYIQIQLIVTGAVQGVGFRPFVYRLAQKLSVQGAVYNEYRGVVINIEGPSATLDTFIQQLKTQHPRSANIRSIDIEPLPLHGYEDFSIQPSAASGSPRVDILPDLSSCDACIAEANDPSDRRYQYAFTSCTQCGPRWSIIKQIPYDRDKTTMDDFPFCTECEQEYTNPLSRRFHHQANACPRCGPQLTLYDTNKNCLAHENEALAKTIDAINSGLTVALKGIGGYQLIIDANNAVAIKQLRERKQRFRKPLALMCKDIAQVKSICTCSKAEQALLQTPAAPIVLLKKRADQNSVAEQAAPGNPYLGIMLPTTILHHLLLQEFGKPLIVTSGNVSGEPICIDDADAFTRLSAIADLFLMHNRAIVRPLDDSVAQVVLNKPMLLRRARGYAPTPITIEHQINNSPSTSTILAVGSYLKNTIATNLENRVLLGAHIGDLDNLVSRQVFKQRIQNLCDVYQLQPELVVHDAHPDYPSTHYAVNSGLKCHAVQHHHAHIAACMAEHGLTETMLGIAWDGIGLGDDGSAWGGEFLFADLMGYKRVASFLPFPLIGGDKAAQDPRRAAFGVLSDLYAHDPQSLLNNPVLKLFSPQEKSIFTTMLEKNINITKTSSVGRLFDAAACLLGIGNENNFEGEAAMALQFSAEQADVNYISTYKHFKLPFINKQEVERIDWRPLIQRLITDKEAGESNENLAYLFHRVMADSIIDFCQAHKISQLALTGGCFQNRLLLFLVVAALEKLNIKAYWPQAIPPNDGGIAFGQLAIGYHLINNKSSLR